MKIYLAAAFAILLCSCSDDPVSESIIGTWELQSVEATGCDDPDDNVALTEVDDNDCIVLDSESICNVFFTFAADGTGTLTFTEDGGTDVEDYTYTTNDDNDTVLLCDSPSDCQTVSVDGGEFTLTFIDDGCTRKLVYKKA